MIRTLRIPIFLPAIILLGVGTTVWAARDDSAGLDSADDAVQTALRSKTIDQLITQLGDEHYLNRRSSELRLIELGVEAFDQLQAAKSHSDLEIASRAAYILDRIRIDWVRAEDSAEVQTILQNYSNLSDSERRERIDKLEKLETHEGLRALCRIARYDKSPLRAKMAAMEFLRSKTDPLASSESDYPLLLAEIEGSGRVSVEWIQLYLDQLKHPGDNRDEWLSRIDAEIELYRQESSETAKPVVLGLLQFHLDLCARFSQPQLAFQTLQRWVDLLIEKGGRENESLVPALLWVLENKQWETLESVESHYAQQIRESRLLLYLSAMARTKQGKNAEAEEFAERAFRREEDKPTERYLVTAIIEDLGRHDWAEREWKYLVDSLPILDDVSARARDNLASLRLHDRGEDQAAAELVAEYCDVINADPSKKKGILTDHNKRYFYQHFGAQRDYFLACHAKQQGNFAKQRQFLNAAIKAEPLNPDVLIAMYHSEEADQAYRKQTVNLIGGVSKQLESNIQQDPENAQGYNHWAWLVSNTEGDYDKAVKYSLRSLELSPDSPSLLDTLGRCYYAAGDLENAVKYQRQAVEGCPHLLVMRRQLDLFERELAQRVEK